MSKFLEMVKKDKLKSAVIAISCLVFIVGLVMTIANTGDTYSESTSDYKCSTYGYEVVASNGKYACCPSGYSYYSDSEECRKYFYGNDYGSQAAASQASRKECDSPQISGNSIYCAVTSETANPKISSCYYCTGGSTLGSNYFWGSQPASSTCNGGSWTTTTKTTESECVGKCYACYTDKTYEWSVGTPTTSCSGGIEWSAVSGITTESECLGKCYVCPITGAYEWNINYPSTACTGNQSTGWSVDTDITEASACVASEDTESPTTYTVTVQYSVNEGTITSSTTDENGEKISWTVNSNSIIQKNGSVYQTIINYGSETGTDGLVNYNNEKYINITRSGYSAPSGSEWKCLSGCSTSGKTYSQSAKYSASDFCDASSKSCTVVLGVNWQSNTTEGGDTTVADYKVTLNNRNAGTAGTPILYVKGSDGIYLDSSYSKKMTTSTNNITVPTKTGYTFGGYYTGDYGSGVQIISKDGYITSSFVSTDYTSDLTIYAKWTANTYTVSYDKNAYDATGTTSNSSHTFGERKQLTKNGFSRTNYTFMGWAEKPDGEVVHEDEKYVTNLTSVNNKTVTLYAVWKSNTTGNEGTTTYTVKYDANGGTGAPSSQTKTNGKDLTLSSTKPTKIGYTFLGWGTASSDTSAAYAAGGKYTNDANVTLYAVWKNNTYSIVLTLHNGTITGDVTSATYDEVVTIKNPTKTVTIVGNANKTDATIGEKVTTEIKFAGWTSSSINTNTAYYDDTAWTNGNTKVTATTFKNLTATNGGAVAMAAHWEGETVTLPTVTKEGYTCNWNTKADGTGTDYASGGEYVIISNSTATVNLYAECTADSKTDDSKTDEEVDTSPKTGDALIVLAWLIGIGAIGYSVYYFRSRKSDI